MSRKNYIRNWFSNMLEFDHLLRRQGIEYRTVENFYQAMKTDKDDLETRRRIAWPTLTRPSASGAQCNCEPIGRRFTLP
jgi:predicted NAD-dependent protein-ADP-ribosyltransferase YbiA (DUF1768 family)